MKDKPSEQDKAWARGKEVGYEQGRNEAERKWKEELKLAHECISFKGLYCDNSDCKNWACPCHKNFGKGGLR